MTPVAVYIYTRSLHYSILDIVSTIKAGIIYSIIVIIYFGGTYYG